MVRLFKKLNIKIRNSRNWNSGSKSTYSYFLYRKVRNVSENYLKILTLKKHPKIKLQHLRKIRIGTFGLLLHQINSI